MTTIHWLFEWCMIIAAVLVMLIGLAALVLAALYLWDYTVTKWLEYKGLKRDFLEWLREKYSKKVKRMQ